MLKKFPREATCEILEHEVSTKRELWLFFEEVQQHRFLLSSGLIVFFRIRKNRAIFRVFARHDPNIYRKKDWAAEAVSAFKFPADFKSWKAFFSALYKEEPTNTHSHIRYEFDPAEREVWHVIDSNGFRLSYDELSQVLLLYRKIARGEIASDSQKRPAE